MLRHEHHPPPPSELSTFVNERNADDNHLSIRRALDRTRHLLKSNVNGHESAPTREVAHDLAARPVVCLYRAGDDVCVDDCPHSTPTKSCHELYGHVECTSTSSVHVWMYVQYVCVSRVIQSRQRIHHVNSPQVSQSHATASNNTNE